MAAAGAGNPTTALDRVLANAAPMGVATVVVAGQASVNGAKTRAAVHRDAIAIPTMTTDDDDDSEQNNNWNKGGGKGKGGGNKYNNNKNNNKNNNNKNNKRQ